MILLKKTFLCFIVFVASFSACFSTGISSCEATIVSSLKKVKPSKSVPHPHIGGNKALRVIRTINQELAGKVHPVSGVPFRAVVTTIKGIPTSVVVPRFNSIFTMSLPKHLLGASREVHFERCTANLARAIKKDTVLASKFTKRQLEQIRNGSPKIDGLTWHHSEREGVMELVDEIVHLQTAHTGGYSLWGAVSEIGG